VVVCLEQGAYCLHMVQLMPMHPKPHDLLLHLNPDWFHLSGTGFTQVILENRPLNGCVE